MPVPWTKKVSIKQHPSSQVRGHLRKTPKPIRVGDESTKTSAGGTGMTPVIPSSIPSWESCSNRMTLSFAVPLGSISRTFLSSPIPGPASPVRALPVFVASWLRDPPQALLGPPRRDTTTTTTMGLRTCNPRPTTLEECARARSAPFCAAGGRASKGGGSL